MREEYTRSDQTKKDTNFIFGLRAIIEAMSSDKEVDKILLKKEASNPLVKELLSLATQLGVPVQYVPVQKIDRVTRKNHQGALAYISPVAYQNIEEVIPRLFEEGKNPFIIILDGLTDVRNFGAIARSAECAGAHAILMPAKGSAQINADAIKTSAGALMKIPVCRTFNLADSVKFLKNSGVVVLGLSEKATLNYTEVDLSAPIAIVMGAEDHGLSKEVLQKADYLLQIPILGEIQSLNVSVAASVIMYEAVRQRNL